MNWDIIIRIGLMVALLVSSAANLHFAAERDASLIVAATYRVCLDAEMTLPYCDEFVVPAVLEELGQGEGQ